MASDIEQRNFLDKDGLEQFWDDIQIYLTRKYKELPPGMQFSRIYQENGRLHILVEPFGGSTEDRKVASRANLSVYSKAEIDTNYKTKQDGVSEQFTEYQTLLDISQDTNGAISMRKQVIPTATVGTLGLTTLKGVVSAGDGDNSTATTPKAVADAIAATIAELDVSEVSIGKAKTVGTISEVDGKIVVTAVDILVDNSNIADGAVTYDKVTNTDGHPFAIDISGNANTVTNVHPGGALDQRIKYIEDGKADKVDNAIEGHFAGLDANGNLTDSGYNASDFKNKQTPITKTGATNKTVTSITQNANGEIDATFGEIQPATTEQKGVVQLADTIGTTVEIENNLVATEKAVRDAIDDSLDATIKTLDVDEVGGSGKYISAIAETDGKISATVTSMDTAPSPNSTKAITSGGVFSAIASLDSSVADSSANVTVSVTEADGKLASIAITDSAAASDHVHGNISNDGRVGTDTNKVLVTTTGGMVIAGAIDGTYDSATNKIATQTTVSNAINSLDVEDKVLRMRYANTNTLRFYRGVPIL